jgi:hypothetical protein
MSSRRGLLASAGVLAAGAGCTGLNPLAEREPLPRLGTISILNSDDIAHELSVRIERDGERLLAETYELGPRGGDGDPPRAAEIPCGVGSARGRYTLSVETAAGEASTLELGRGDGPTFVVVVGISEDGLPGIFGNSYPYERICDQPSPTPE